MAKKANPNELLKQVCRETMAILMSKTQATGSKKWFSDDYIRAAMNEAYVKVKQP